MQFSNSNLVLAVSVFYMDVAIVYCPWESVGGELVTSTLENSGSITYPQCVVYYTRLIATAVAGDGNYSMIGIVCPVPLGLYDVMGSVVC